MRLFVSATAALALLVAISAVAALISSLPAADTVILSLAFPTRRAISTCAGSATSIARSATETVSKPS